MIELEAKLDDGENDEIKRYLGSSSEACWSVADFRRFLGLAARPQGGQYDDNDEQDQDKDQEER